MSVKKLKKLLKDFPHFSKKNYLIIEAEETICYLCGNKLNGYHEINIKVKDICFTLVVALLQFINEINYILVIACNTSVYDINLIMAEIAKKVKVCNYLCIVKNIYSFH